MNQKTEQQYVLSQINIAQPVSSLQSKQLQGFVSRLDEINALADRSEGFVWRLQDEAGVATSVQSDSCPDAIINMSLWRDIESLRAYVFETAHLEVLQMKSQWFVRRSDTTAAMWWRPNHQVSGRAAQAGASGPPTVDEGMAKLAELEQRGSTPFAFSFGQPWPAPFNLASRAELQADDCQFAPVEESDLPAVVELLDACDLVTEDLESSWQQGGFAYFIKGVDDDGRMVAIGGLEPRKTNAIVRSVAVADDARGKGAGRALVTVLERLAHDRKLNKLFLLTESAERFFRLRGFKPIERNRVPREIGELAQFASLCPDSAACLVKQLP